ncbi:transketolase 1 [Candidatus Phycosocius bacilliformis]|uniref:Transketolase n=1 Tax=Candidatus Phycosocius bacilliformis TaxID=1445552 RepID=A0A2P2E6P2_9PROT|nr:transketolase [Candidatus Phycosocius bacilliformis]GBF56735.1 transketolase 1 [Candidatus Phycosocius bacilliformis]
MTSHHDLANAIRFLSMDAVQAANSGHPGMPMGMADVATVLFTKFLKFDAKAPNWHDRDRFVLSAGHGSMLIYSLLHLTGYEAMTLDQLKAFRQIGALTAGHPEYGHVPGVETTTGPLGQGISTAVGMAMAEAHLRATLGSDVVDHHTWVIASDGDLMEGISHEAISLAGHLKLNRLIVLWDDNEISIDGALSVAETGDQLKRFDAAGWATSKVDGHDPVALEAAMSAALQSDKPVLIACRTQIGYGSPNLAGTAKTHGSPLGATEIEATRQALNWPHAPFVVPDEIVSTWRAAGSRGAAAHADWKARLAARADAEAIEARLASRVDAKALRQLVADHAGAMAAKTPSMATRESSGAALETLVPAFDVLMGGSADLTGSVNTKVSGMSAYGAKDYAARYVHYGVREHGMAAAMNGMALHGGVVPYAGTFLVFADYLRPALRLGALMGVRTIHVLTHDSIGLGEDGPTHQPVETLASLRAIPNVQVFRPCDPVEVAECWELALLADTTPSVLSLTRQKLPFQRRDGSPVNRSAQGAYVLSPSSLAEKAVLIATGSEVEIAMAAQARLAESGIGVRVVSAPCLELFAAQSADYQDEVLGGNLPKVAIEAAVRFGWDRWIGPKGTFIGMTGFGASGPYQALYSHFGITAEAVCAAVQALD